MLSSTSVPRHHYHHHHHHYTHRFPPPHQLPSPAPPLDTHPHNRYSLPPAPPPPPPHLKLISAGAINTTRQIISPHYLYRHPCRSFKSFTEIPPPRPLLARRSLDLAQPRVYYVRTKYSLHLYHLLRLKSPVPPDTPRF